MKYHDNHDKNSGSCKIIHEILNPSFILVGNLTGTMLAAQLSSVVSESQASLILFPPIHPNIPAGVTYLVSTPVV